jgi:hypothetical protein
MKTAYFKNIFFVKENRETICKLPWNCKEIVESKLLPTIGGTFQLELYCRRQCKSCSQLHFKKGSGERLNLTGMGVNLPEPAESPVKQDPVDERKLMELWKKGVTITGIARELNIPLKNVQAIVKRLNLQPRRIAKIIAR